MVFTQEFYLFASYHIKNSKIGLLIFCDFFIPFSLLASRRVD